MKSMNGGEFESKAHGSKEPVPADFFPSFQLHGATRRGSRTAHHSSRRDDLIIARRFNAGFEFASDSSPEGTAERTRDLVARRDTKHSCSNLSREITNTLRAFLPLLGGEGRGEEVVLTNFSPAPQAHAPVRTARN
jgi:hypothetical protein